MVVVCDPPAGTGVPPRPRRASSDPPAAAVAVFIIGDAPKGRLGRAMNGSALHVDWTCINGVCELALFAVFLSRFS